MKIGIYFYGLATVAFGILDLIWGRFDQSHQAIKSMGDNVFDLRVLAYIAAVWMIAAGLAMLRPRSMRAGAAASAIIYSIFVACFVIRVAMAIHALGWRFDVLFGSLFSIGQAVFLIPAAAIIYFSAAPNDFVAQEKTGIAARWMLGLPPIFFGLGHLIGLRFFATLVPQWLPFGSAWAALTGIAFILAGVAICAKRVDVLAVRLLALMLLIFEFLVEIPPIFIRVHNEETWGAAVWNLAAIGALWIFAEFVASRRLADPLKTGQAKTSYLAHPVESLATRS